MFCVKCGTQNPDDANFCSKCGTPLKSDQAQWEICQIECVEVKEGGWFSPPEYQFVARVTTPKGPIIVAKSPVFKDPSYEWRKDKVVRAAFDALVNSLLSDGWEYVRAEGEFVWWWKHQFRRKKQ